MVKTNRKGISTELYCIGAFAELGYECYVPNSEDSRYDFIADVDGKLIRVQSKACSIQNNGDSIAFSCRSTRGNTRGNISSLYTKEEIDYFCTYYEGKCYLVPVEECVTEKKLRFTHPKNNQQKAINYASDYELSTQVSKILNKN